MWEFFLRRREDQRKGSRKSSILSSKCKLCFKTKKAKITVTSYKQLSTWRPKSLMTSKVCWALKSISLSINLQNPLRLSMKGFPILRNRLKSFRLQLTLFTLSWMIKLAVLLSNKKSVKKASFCRQTVSQSNVTNITIILTLVCRCSPSWMTLMLSTRVTLSSLKTLSTPSSILIKSMMTKYR